MDTANECACSAVGIGGYAAGIDDNNIGSVETGCGLKSAMTQPGGDCFSIGPAGTASKIFDMVFCHAI
jgi:hypothetical protein